MKKTIAYLDKIRKSKNVSVREMCDKAKVSEKAWYSWKSGNRYPSMNSIEAICESLDINIEYNLN